MDGKNNARLLGGDIFAVEISGPGNMAPETEVTDNNDGWAPHICTQSVPCYPTTQVNAEEKQVMLPSSLPTEVPRRRPSARSIGKGKNCMPACPH